MHLFSLAPARVLISIAGCDIFTCRSVAMTHTSFPCPMAQPPPARRLLHSCSPKRNKLLAATTDQSRPPRLRLQLLQTENHDRGPVEVHDWLTRRNLVRRMS